MFEKENSERKKKKNHKNKPKTKKRSVRKSQGNSKKGGFHGHFKFYFSIVELQQG